MFSSLYFIAFSACAALVSAGTNVTGFYPQIKGNLTMITWEHDSQPPFNDEWVMMLSENITSIKDKSGVITPVLNKNQKVTLENLLGSVELTNIYYNVSKGHGEGVKLQFTEVDAMSSSLPILQKHSKANYPMVIAADILEGTSKPTLDSSMFFKLLENSKDLADKVILSVGWTNNAKLRAYPDDGIKEMGKILKDKKDFNFNFPVRACAVAKTNSTFKQLLTNITGSTVTVFSMPNDTVNVDALRSFVLDIGVNRTFLDVPQDLRDKLRLDQKASGSFRTVSALGVIAWAALLLRLF
ncbi:unnamed protein product [Phyllotreta striolata]|uniref:Menorin-like domain-containing protein n=1 Tax=Phyllotreta striolata TaxID=444603 RepID=A0A9N9TKZ6_PHYSR|nr:unnamed protein product [Phyllotreta striolata]